MTAAAVLAEVQRLLERHAAAVRDGDAEAVAAHGARLRDVVALLSRALPPAALHDSAPALRTLLAQALRTQAMLTHRQADVERSLRALFAGQPESAAAQRVYGRQGTLGGAGARGRAFARA